MANEIIINATIQETRVALLEEGALAELYVERTKDRGIMGNIYKGKVVKVLPGMQAAFVDIGLEKAAFLYVSDVYGRVEDYEDMGFPRDEMPLYLNPPSQIEDLLSEGQEVLVQVSKEPLGTKGTRITSHITLPGRYLVYMPTVDHVGVSRRIKDEKERKRLREIVLGIRPPSGGFIVRTASEGAEPDEIRNDMEFLIRLWSNTQKKKENATAPSLIHSDLTMVLRVIRDILSSQVNRIVIDSKEEYENILSFINTYMPKQKFDIILYEGEEPIFDSYGIEVEIDKLLGRKELLLARHTDVKKLNWPKGSGIYLGITRERIKMYEVEAIYKEPHYTYSKQVWYIDPENWLILIKKTWDEDGKLWRLNENLYQVMKTNAGEEAFVPAGTMNLDTRGRHASINLVPETKNIGKNFPLSQFNLNALQQYNY